MKLQHLAVIFVLIIVPISLVLSTYTDGLIKVINSESHYDTVLSNATYDAIRAYQLNTIHNSFASVNNSRERDINASVNSFFNSLSLGLDKTGNSKNELNEYIPAMLFTLYDGYYVYGPFKNVGSVGTVGSGLKRAQYATDENTKVEYGLMPYTYYSCEYKGGTGERAFDLVINYSLDNYISVSGTFGSKYITSSGYYIDADKVEIKDSQRQAIIKKGDRNIIIEPETLGEYISFTDEKQVTDTNGRPRVVKQAVHETPVYYNYINYNEVKYYLMPSTETAGESTSYSGIPIFFLDNDVRVFINNEMLKQLAEQTKFPGWESNPMGLCNIGNFKDTNAFNYYKSAKQFSENVYDYLKDINIRENDDGTYGDVSSTFFNNKYEIYPANTNKKDDDYNSAHVKISYSELSSAHPFDYKLNENNPEEEISIFNNHRIDVIVSSIESSLVNSIGNFNNYVSNTYSYAMPTLSENDWYKISNNVTTVSFMQGLPVGKYKFYSNYAVVTNKKNKEFVGRDAIYVQDTVEGLSQEQYKQNYITKSAPEFHSPSCEDYNKNKTGNTGIVGYRNIDYEEEPVLNTYPVLKNNQIQNDDSGKRVEQTQSLNYYFQPGTGAYECIVSRNQNRITTDDLIGQKSSKTVRRNNETTSTVLPISEAVQRAYISALAREKGASYKHHSGLNYHKYMTNGTQIGENIDKTYNDIDKNFTSEDKLNVPTVSDPTYNGGSTPVAVPSYPRDYQFDGKVITLKVGDRIQSNDLVNTNSSMTPIIKSISDTNIANNNINGIVGGSIIQGLSVGQTSVFLQISVNGTTYTARSTINVLPADSTASGPEIQNQSIRIYQVATGEKEITNTNVTLLINEKMNIKATKTEKSDGLTATSTNPNKVKVQQWNIANDTGIIKGNGKTQNPETVTISGNRQVKGTNKVASSSFTCNVKQQEISIGNIAITAGESKRIGIDQSADIKVNLVKDEGLTYRLYTYDKNVGAITFDQNNNRIVANRSGIATLVITGKTSGATRQVTITATDDRALYYATLHTDGTLAFANSENASKISGKRVRRVYKVTEGNEQKFITDTNENNSITEIRFNERITVRGQRISWFIELPNLTRIVNANNLSTQNITDMRKMFFNCPKLAGNLDLNSWNVGNVEYMNQMFDGCTSISGISLSNWNTSKVRNMQYMFHDCKKLSSLTANAVSGAWNVYNVLNMQYMFGGCSNLRTVALSNWNTGNVDSMEHMFAECSVLASINLSSWNTSKLKNARSMFEKCTGLRTVIANTSSGRWTTANIENMSSMFSGCSNVTTLSLASWDTRKADRMEYIFFGCSSIQSINLSSWITSSNTLGRDKEKIQEFMFGDCTSLRELNLSNWSLGQNVNSMFSNCKSLQSPRFTIGNVNTSGTKNMNAMFMNCESLAYVVLPTNGNYWNVSNVTTMSNMFANCKRLRGMVFENWDVRNVKTMRNMFRGNDVLPEIDLNCFNKNWNNEGVDLAYMFAYCTKLQDLRLHGLVNNKVSNISGMFEGCKALTTFNWNDWGWNISEVTDMSSFLRGCTELRTANLDLSRAGGEVKKIQKLEKVFGGCRKLTDVTMSNWRANNLTSLSKLYEYCNSLETVIMNNWSSTRCWSINELYDDCPNLVNVTMSGWYMPNVTSLYALFEGKAKLQQATLSNWQGVGLKSLVSMFRGCTELESVNLSNMNTVNVSSMINMFSYCSSLRTIYFTGLNTTSIPEYYYMYGMFVGSSNAFTIVTNREELNTASSARGKLKRAYDEEAYEHRYTYQTTSHRFRVFGHLPLYGGIIIGDRIYDHLIGVINPDRDPYSYGWSGYVNFISI